MRRAFFLVLAAVIFFTIGCSGGSAPTSSSRTAVGPPAGVLTVSPAPVLTLFGGSVVDFARCLHAAPDPGCFAAARIQPRAAGAAATTPAAPINLSSVSSGNTVTLTWGAPSSGDPVTTYVIEAGSGPGLANLANFTTNSTGTTFSAIGVGAGTYYVRVRAQNAGGTGAVSNESILIVGSAGCAVTPNAPAGLAITVSGSTVALTWSGPAGGCASTSYMLQAGSAAGLSDLANSNVGNATSYVAAGVGAGTYYVRVRAMNGSGASGPSNEVVVTVGAPAPTGMTGRWVGLAPDGILITDPGPDPFDSCALELDLQFDLTQTGSTLSGTVTRRVRKIRARGGEECVVFLGSVATGPLSGTVGAGAVSFTTGGYGTLSFEGTFTTTRMTGRVAASDRTFLAATFAVHRP